LGVGEASIAKILFGDADDTSSLRPILSVIGEVRLQSEACRYRTRNHASSDPPGASFPAGGAAASMGGPLGYVGVWLAGRANNTAELVAVYGASGEKRFPDLTDAA
jgi:hypothetical protein